ncbi:flagellar basal body P-ring formation chaperone FlgA [Maricaulaceae bacterium NA33B04]|nr:flagellar basal body P-ring formation chaperone FlgA [Maricaulaceae bacterium NA33B04]
MIRASLAALILATAPAVADTSDVTQTRTVILAERLVADGPIITLGDLFDNAGEAAGVDIARAPAPGAQISLDPAYVREAAAREGLVWANASGVLRVTVEREARQVSAAEIASLLEESLFVETGQAHAVRLSNSRLSLAAPMDSFGGPELISFYHDAGSGMIRAEIAAYPGGEPVRISGRAEQVVDVPVLGRAVAIGTVITAGDIDWVQLPANRVNAQVLLDPEGLIGMAARRPLRADTPLRGFDVEAPSIIERGEIVNLIFQSGPLTLSARARAMEDGAAGELIRFVNLQSNRTVEAVADAPGRARVTGPAYTH